MAVYTILRLLLSKEQYAQRIAKCLECETYYWRKRIRREDGFFVYGKRCPNAECRKAGNLKRANASRDRERSNLFKIAAEASMTYQANHQTTKEDWILEKVNAARRNPKHTNPKQKKWLSQNSANIQKRMEEIANGRL